MNWLSRCSRYKYPITEVLARSNLLDFLGGAAVDALAVPKVSLTIGFSRLRATGKMRL